MSGKLYVDLLNPTNGQPFTSRAGSGGDDRDPLPEEGTSPLVQEEDPELQERISEALKGRGVQELA